MSLALASRRAAISPAWVKNPLWRTARAVPSLDLPFADTKSLVDAVTGQSLVTFTRASSGTYTDSQGVLRTATTNLLLRSEEFDLADWTKTNSSVTANATSAPTGSATADKFVEGTAVSSDPSVVSTTSIAYISGFTYAFSVFAKAAERTSLRVVFHPNPFPGTAGQRTATFDLTLGSFSSVGSAYASSSAQALGNGWYRIALSMVSDASTTGNPTIVIGSAPYTGDGTSGLYLWGAQLEASSAVGEYVPTTSTINSAPRFDHNPTTGESLGLLVEEQRTNLLLNSATLSTQSVTVTAAAHTLSFTGTGTITLSGASTAGPLVGTGTGEGNRVSLTFTPTAGTLTLTVSGTVSNAQLEVGSFRTSYIPTTTATATRNADVASITGTAFSSWYSQSEGTVFASTSVLAIAPTTLLQTQYAIHDGSTDNRITIYKRANADTSTRLDITAATVSSAFINAGTFGLNNLTASAIRANDFAVSLNGLSAVVDTSGNVPSVNQITLGSYVGATGFINGTIRRLCYWGQRLPDSILQTITR